MGGPLRVLHVVVNMNRGGAETLIMNLYRNIDRSKVQFDFLTCNEGVFDEEIKSLGGIVHRIPYVTEVGHRVYIKHLNQFFEQNDHYKIVHSHMDKMSGFVLRAANRAGVPVRIAHSHNTSSEGGTLAKTYKWFAGKAIPKYATEYYACSNKAAHWLFTKKASQSFIIKNGVEYDRFSYSKVNREKIRKAYNLTPDSLAIGHIGRFNHQKNHSFLLDVFAKVVERRPDSHLFLIGGGTLQKEIEEKVKKLRLTDRVHLLGIRDDTHLWYQAFDVFAFPSLHEGLPVTLIEAQCAGVPCMISNNITDEVDLGLGLVNKLSIKQSEVWADSLSGFQYQNQLRKTDRDLISVKGYDICQTATATQTSYIKLGGKNS